MSSCLVPGASFRPVIESGRFGKQTGAGLSKFRAPSVCKVITRAGVTPGGSGPGNRSGGTGAIPTLPPRLPSSLKSELAGTVTETPARAALLATTEAGKVIVESTVLLTGCSVP